MAKITDIQSKMFRIFSELSAGTIIVTPVIGDTVCDYESLNHSFKLFFQKHQFTQEQNK